MKRLNVYARLWQGSALCVYSTRGQLILIGFYRQNAGAMYRQQQMLSQITGLNCLVPVSAVSLRRISANVMDEGEFSEKERTRSLTGFSPPVDITAAGLFGKTCQTVLSYG
ncbi:hypothetical protein DPEC_G00014890 [Dallia pectoralis]|uniref:Uncharacterized protein n=1 Tax=Dallia pectoralis TaxID=75939 RepID=A0ACC2HMK1_DALPE|nr:hypothetical protein DPEC_G00014890 [Dallia pectoralis]